MLSRVLTEHRVTAVTGASAALELLDSGAVFDVILSDLMMPEMSGVELYQALSSRFPEYTKKIVFVSGGAFTPATRQFLEHVGTKLVEKPFEPDFIRELVRGYVADAKRR
jgi:CheY-like chemotaxis protein